MVDENGRRSIPIPPEQQEGKGGDSYVAAASEMGSAAIKGMAPADKGWILASVIVILGAMALLEVTNYMDNSNRHVANEKFFTTMESHRSEENRRLQEQNRILAQALARQSDRLGRQKAINEGVKDMSNYVEKRKYQ